MAHWKKYLEHFITYEIEMMTKRVNKTVINLKKKRIDVSRYSWVRELIDNFIWTVSKVNELFIGVFCVWERSTLHKKCNLHTL